MGGHESSLKKRSGPITWLKKKSGQQQQAINRSLDLSRSIREYLESLNEEQLTYLATTYQQLSIEKFYYTASMKARPSPPTLHQDFSDLLDYKYNSDVELQLPSANFLAHRSLLQQRSGYFQCNLSSNKCLKLNVLDVRGFSEVLSFCYTDEVGEEVAARSEGARGTVNSRDSGLGAASHMSYNSRGDLNVLGATATTTPRVPPNAFSWLRLSTRSLVEDLEDLFRTRRFADCLLIWSQQQRRNNEEHVTKEQLAHVAVLSARSPLLRSLLGKKKQLYLDCNVIKWCYSHCLLYFMYTDILDMNLIEGWSEDNDLIAHLEELYYCGQFLELDSLTYKVESLIESQINVSTYLRILSWANESFGSKYIRRCCLLFMEECWFHLVQDNGYYAIPLECLVEIVQSDFTQCPESELVESLLRWSSANCMTIPGVLLQSLRLDYITNTALLKQVTRGLKPSLMMQSRPRYWGPIHEQLMMMISEGVAVQAIPFDVAGAAASGNFEDGMLCVGDLPIEVEQFTQILQRYNQLQQDSVDCLTDNIIHWLRLQVLREFGFPESYEKCLISSNQHQVIEPQVPTTASNHAQQEQQTEEDQQRLLPDVAVDIIDPIVNLDLGDRFRH